MRLVALVALIGGLVACAVLPDYHPLLEHGARANVRLVGARCVLSQHGFLELLAE